MVHSREGEINMGGGTYYQMGAQGIVAAGTLYNPNYGKMAADSIAKELEERKLLSPTTSVEPGQDQAAPTTSADEIPPGKNQGTA
jgi:hypothetical protein